MIWIIIFILIIILTIPKISEYYDNVKLDIGNRLSAYFFNLGLAILQKKDFINDEKYVYDSHFFFQYIPGTIKYDFDDIHNCLISKGIKYEDFSKIWDVSGWEIETDERYYFWQCMKPLVHQILDDTFKKCNLDKKVEYPIIHFRCADTPFNKHSMYHFQYYPFFKDALEKIFIKLNKRYDNLYIMSCNLHKSNDTMKESCNIYVNSLQEYLKDNNFNSEIVCNSNIDDFATLFYAPAIISTSSSFSFMSGFFGNGIFISSELKNKKEEDCKSCNNVILYGYNLSHEKVNDYNDTETIIDKLKNFLKSFIQ